MRIPILEELIIDENSSLGVEDALKKTKLGKAPVFCVLDGICHSADEVNELLDTLEAKLLRQGVHPTWPYPFYIVSTHVTYHPFFAIIKSVESLPEHFVKRSGRVRNSEMTLLNKSIILTNKINNSSLYEKLDELSFVISQQQELFNLTKELDFYEEIKKRMGQETL